MSYLNKSIPVSPLRVRSRLKAGGFNNHGLKVRTALRSGAAGPEGMGGMNHGLKVRTEVKAGGGPIGVGGMNHGLRVRSAVDYSQR